MAHLDIEIYGNHYKHLGDIDWREYSTLSELKQQLIKERAENVNNWIDESPTEKMRKHRIKMSKNAYLKDSDITFYNACGFGGIVV